MKSIRVKIFLSFFIFASLITLTMAVVSHQSTKRQFLKYVNNETIQKLAFLERAIILEFEKHQSLTIFAKRPRKWEKLIEETFRPHVSRMNNHKRDHTSQAKRAPAEKNKHAFSQPNSSPLNRHTSRKANRHQREFISRLALTDPQKNMIAGPPIINARYLYTSIHLNNQLLGYIGYIKPKDFIRENDQAFIFQQIQQLLKASFFIFIGSLIAAFFISRWIVTPIILLSESVKKIAAGDFSARIRATSPDELGALGFNVNELAHTLEKNEASRRQWVADISHEMRTPVAVIKAQIEALQDGVRKVSPESLTVLADKADALNALISDLYELSLSDAGATTYQKHIFSFNEVYKQIENLCENHLANHQYTFDCLALPKSNSAALNIDKQKILQLITNLIENSIRYTNQPGKIELSANIDLTKKNALIILEDSAPGVPAKYLPQIFNRLFRMETSRNRELGGAGLGLSICKSIVDAHHGDIYAECSSLGGIKIVVMLPLHSSNTI